MSRRRAIQLGEVDLNLMVALHALLESASVTQAAKQVGVTQSAMSHILRRLRAVLGDELLVRGPSGMVRTPRAEAMRDPLYSSLLALQETVRTSAQFRPERAERGFSICATDHTQLLFAPHLVGLVARATPGIKLSFKSYLGERVMDKLLSGEFDLVLAGNLLTPPPQVMRKRVYEDQMACAVRHDHPRIRGELALEDYVALPHLLVAPVGSGPGIADELLAAMDLHRHVAVRVQSFLIAPWILGSSDCVLTAPRRIISAYCRSSGALQILEPPLDIPPVSTFAYWHERNHDDPAMTWLRELVERAFAESHQAAQADA